MKKECCTCGKRVSIVLSPNGHELQGSAYACFDCCNVLGIGKGFMGALKIATMTREKFIAEYNAATSKQNENSVPAPIAIDYSLLTDEELINRVKGYYIEKPTLTLREGEKCYYEGPCFSAKFKNVVTGTTGSSVRFGGFNNSLYTSSGLSNRTYNRETVSERYPGFFYITNQRMVCNAPKLAFEIKLTSITTMVTYEDAIIITCQDRPFIVETTDVEYIKTFINLNNEFESRKLKNAPVKEEVTPKESLIPKSDVPKMLREYKALLDDGIITEEEFQKKKNQLLDL